MPSDDPSGPADYVSGRLMRYFVPDLKTLDTHLVALGNRLIIALTAPTLTAYGRAKIVRNVRHDVDALLDRRLFIMTITGES